MDLNEEVKHDISIHAPREGSDIQGFTCFCIRSAFLSTLPARGATRSRSPGQRRRPDFYPRSPRGERLILGAVLWPAVRISIHAPREGSDKVRPLLPIVMEDISIHAPREGSDHHTALR